MSERRFAIIEERLDRIDEKLEQLRQMYARHQSLIEPNKKPPLGPCQAGAFDEAEAEAYMPSRHQDDWEC